MQFGEKSSADIGVEMDEKERELQSAIRALFEVEQEILLLSRQIIDLQGKKKDFEMSKLKATQNLRVIQSELKILKNAFWASKNQGL